MANIKSSKKDIRRTARRTELNRTVRTRLKNLSKAVDAASDAASIKESGSNYASLADKAVKKGTIHPNKAARIKSKISKAVKKLAK